MLDADEVRTVMNRDETSFIDDTKVGALHGEDYGDVT